MAESQSQEVDGLQAHRAESDRLGRLTEFLSKFAPAVGQSTQTGRPADGECLTVARSRDLAIADGFDAVSRIARTSFAYPPGESPRCSA